jgi:hypothetical protein
MKKPKFDYFRTKFMVNVTNSSYYGDQRATYLKLLELTNVYGIGIKVQPMERDLVEVTTRTCFEFYAKLDRDYVRRSLKALGMISDEIFEGRKVIRKTETWVPVEHMIDGVMIAQ